MMVLGLHCCMDFSLVAGSRGYPLVVVHGLLIAVWLLLLGNTASREHRLQELQYMGSIVAAPRL